MKIKLLVLIILVQMQTGYAMQILSGDLSGFTLSGEYLVTENIYIQKGKSLKIEAGSKIYFEQFTGIMVYGSLFCVGKIDSTIVLTSKKELPGQAKEVTPEAFDWNGIEVSNEADTISVISTKIKNCTFGLNIKSDSTKIRMERIEFFNNGYSSISRCGKDVVTEPEVPFSITWNMSDTTSERLIIRQGKDEPKIDSINAMPEIKQDASKQQINELRQNKKIIIPTLRIGSSVVYLAGITLCTVSYLEKNKQKNAFNNSTEPQRREKLRDTYKKTSIKQLVSGIIGIIGAAGLGLTFLF